MHNSRALYVSARWRYTANTFIVGKAMQYFVILLFLLVSAETAKAGQTSCPLSPDFSLLKEFDTMNSANVRSWSFLYKGRSFYQISGPEIKGIFGGDDTGTGIPADCSDILVNHDNFAIVVGRERDLLIAGGVISGPQGVKAVNFLHYYPHDGRMNIRPDGDNILLTWGNQHDLTTRLCWSPDNQGHWWHGANHRTDGNFGGCVTPEWIWHLPNGQSGVFGTSPSWDHSQIEHIVEIN